jgi:hypothetical protein
MVEGEHFSEELLEQHINSYLEHLHMRPYGSHQCMWLHEHMYMNTLELHWEVGRIALQVVHP